MISNGVTIIVNNNSYHSFNDFGLAIGNNNCIGAPEVETHYIDIPGMNGFLDLTETIAGHVVYTSREIKIDFGGQYTRADWDARISTFRNLFHGKIVKVIFDNDPNYYYTGRAFVEDFDRFRELGTFSFVIPKAEPFKYRNTLTIDQTITFNSGATHIVNLTTPEMCKGPYFVVSNLTGSALTITSNITQTITANGTYYSPDFAVPGTRTYTLSKMDGTATVKWSYYKGSL